MIEIKELTGSDIPARLREIPKAPEKLFVQGNLPDPEKYKYLTVVGSRKYSTYGRESCAKLIQSLARFPVTIVSGLALGIDTIAHETALEAGLPTIAVPGSGLAETVLYPRANLRLAKKIIEAGGALLSEFKPDTQATVYTFPKRNRIMAGLSDATLIIEAAEKSGTLITAKLALDFNREVLAVPGSIFSSGAKGTNQLIRQGATPITKVEDLLEALGLETGEIGPNSNQFLDTLSAPEQLIYQLLQSENLSRDELAIKTTLAAAELNTTLSMMEVKGLIKETGGVFIIT